MTVWMYYTTGGDSGYSNIKLFKAKAVAEQWYRHEKGGHGYGNIEEVIVYD